MENAGSDSHGTKGAETADAEQQFLTNTVAAVTTVKGRCKFSISGGVAFKIGIEGKQGTASNFDAPHFGAEAAANGVDQDKYRSAVLANGGAPPHITLISRAGI